jgi:exodeoxyribonuclease V gamma subunit
MSLAIRYVRSLDEVVDRAAGFLSRPVDFFARQRIVVPTAGAKAWLTAKLAERLGAGSTADGRPAGDGIVAGVDFSYPGTISSLISEKVRSDADPWDVDRLTFTILSVLARDPAFDDVVKRAGGPLLAARRIADRFDHYHFRRPGMILEWEEGRAQLSPEADDQGDRAEKNLPRHDRWQFDLWRKVRERIGEKSPPAREKETSEGAPEAVLVAGLQGLSLHQIHLLSRLAEIPSATERPCEVEVLLVHPSPSLREAWAGSAPPVSHDKSTSPRRGDPKPTPDVDPLVDAWLRGTRESQWLLASQGLFPRHADATPDATPAADAPLLIRLRHTVTTGKAATEAIAFTPDDQSVRIHRCHDLGRQAEVLHDAILHAFREIPDLAPHEVVILSPQIAKLAPHLEAVFNRDVTGDVRDGTAAKLHLPLLVADRGIRDVSRGAELLAALIELVDSRASVDAMLAVATHPLVLAHFGLDDKTLEVWQRCIERTKIRWGLDAARRSRSGLDQPTLTAHTWRLGLERTLLGAVMPDGAPEPALGGVVPLAAVAAADIESLAPLVTIFGIIDDLDREVAACLTDKRPPKRPVSEWCDRLEQSLGQLAGAESDELAVPLKELDRLRQASATARGDSPADVPVPWHDVKTILAATLTAPVGRQPLRTGVITATSLIPLRGVPFRVVCLAGYDDESVAPREGDSDDLAERQHLLGDRDRGLEVRRELLDCLLTAGDRLVITCTGMDVKNNKTLPLVTPLAEFTDFVGRHGVPTFEHAGERLSAIEIVHPRHACSRRNFVGGENGVLATAKPWSHDAAALAAAKALGREPERPAVKAAGSATKSPAIPEVIELKDLAEFMHDPLWPYVRKTLGINTWREDDLSTPATLPLELERLDKKRLLDDYIEQLLAAGDSTARKALEKSWAAAVTANGDVPVLGFGDAAVAEITQFSAALLELAEDKDVPLPDGRQRDIALSLDGVTLTGRIERCYPDTENVETIVLVRPDAIKTNKRDFLVAKALAGLQLLELKSAGQAAKALILSQYCDWHPSTGDERAPAEEVVQVRQVQLADAIDSAMAGRMLRDLCALYTQAARQPRGLFDDTADHLPNDLDAALEAFTKFTTNDEYSNSKEVIVYGGQPSFSHVFDDTDDERWSSLIGFYRRFQSLTRIAYRNPNYVYAPDTP